MGLFTPKWMKELSEKECNKHYEMKKRQKNPFRQLLSTVAVTILVLGLSGCGTDNQARVYQAAKSKLDYAENLGGGIAAYQVENAYQEALDALDALGDYEDAPELADRAREYFYASGTWRINPSAKEYQSNTYETAKALLERIPDYKDTSDWLVLNEAINLACNGDLDKAAELVNALPESFDDNFYKTAVFLFYDIKAGNWTSAIDGYELIEEYIANANEISGLGNAYVIAKNCFSKIMYSAENTSPEITAFFDTPFTGGFVERLFYRYYSEQMRLGNDITKLDFHPFVQSGDGTCSVDAAFGTVDVSALFWDISHSLEASLTENDLLTYYATDRAPVTSLKITKDKICVIETSNHDEDIRVSTPDFSCYFSLLSLAQSADEVRYLCRIYDDYTQTYIKSSGGFLYSIESTVKIFDLTTGELLLECKYHKNQKPSKTTSDFDEVWNNTVIPVLSEIVEVYKR